MCRCNECAPYMEQAMLFALIIGRWFLPKSAGITSYVFYRQEIQPVLYPFYFQLLRKSVTLVSVSLALTDYCNSKRSQLTIIFSVKVEHFRVDRKCFRWDWTSGSSGMHGFRLGWLAALPCLLFKSWESNVTHFVGRKIICIETGKSIRYHKACQVQVQLQCNAQLLPRWVQAVQTCLS